MVENEQTVNKEYSKWALMDKIYEAKKYYYGSGSSKISDNEYDALERSFKAIHGEEVFKELYCVGYDADRHFKIIKELKKYNELCKKYFLAKNNN